MHLTQQCIDEKYNQGILGREITWTYRYGRQKKKRHKRKCERFRLAFTRIRELRNRTFSQNARQGGFFFFFNMKFNSVVYVRCLMIFLSVVWILILASSTASFQVFFIFLCLHGAPIGHHNTAKLRYFIVFSGSSGFAETEFL